MKTISGAPDPKHVPTSFLGRQNWTVRTTMRRYTRLSNGFSRNIENHAAGTTLDSFGYNLVKIHRTLRMSPAIAAGVTSVLLTTTTHPPPASPFPARWTILTSAQPYRVSGPPPPSLPCRTTVGAKVLDPALAKTPERPIGSPTGVNRDDAGRARFTTISGAPVQRLYTEADLPETG